MADIYRARVDINAGKDKAGNERKFPKGSAVQGFSDKELEALLASNAVEKVATLPEHAAVQEAAEARAKAAEDEVAGLKAQVEALTKQLEEAEARAKAAAPAAPATGKTEAKP